MRQYDIWFIKKLKEKDHATFTTFYVETVDVFFRYIHGNYDLSEQDNQDIIADFYVKFWENCHKLNESQSFSGYIWTMFKNTLKDHFKKSTDIPFTHLDNPEEENTFEDSLIDEEDIGNFLEQDFQLHTIKNAMNEMDDISRDIIHRKYTEGKEHEEIELILGISHENFRQKLSRALKQLKYILIKNNK